MTSFKNILVTLRESIMEISEILRNNNSLILGSHTNDNNHSGDDVKHFDIASNDLLIKNLKKCTNIKRIFSEEIDEPIMVNPDGDYMVTFDPLDGSGNLDVNISSGTIFAIFIDDDDMIINTKNIVAAGYGLYSAATQYVEVTDTCNIYQNINSTWHIISQNHNIPMNKKLYSFNHSNHDYIHPELDDLFKQAIDNKSSVRWAGCMVADAHRILLKGGWWCYPATKKNPNGKIRLLYEAIPYAFMFKVCGGKYSTFNDNDILNMKINMKTDNCHIKVPVFLSS